MEKLKENASEQEWIDFTMAMVRRAYDERNLPYWFSSDNEAIEIDYCNISFYVYINPGKVSILMRRGCIPDVSSEIDGIIGDSSFVRYEKEFDVRDFQDAYSETCELIHVESYSYEFIGEVKIENRVDPDYLKTVGDNIEEMMRVMTDLNRLIDSKQ